MHFKKILLFAFLILCIGWQKNVKAQTTLAAGDILFTSYSSLSSATPDMFSFVLLKPIAASTVIYFTDRGYFGGTTWQASSSNEGTVSWTAGSALPIGTEVKIAGLGAAAATVNGVANGSVAQVAGGSATNGLLLSSTAGDQIIAFQGGAGDPASGTMIAGINWMVTCGYASITDWNLGCTNSTFSSLMPPGLTGGTNAFLANAGSGSNNTEGTFNCTGTPYTTVSSLKAAILSASNWTFNFDIIPLISIPAGCSFYSTCSNPVITVNTSNRTVCDGSNTTFSITATGASSYQWQVNTGSGFSNISNGGVYANATTATLSITGAGTAMNGYLYRCVASSGSCTTTSSNATLTISKPAVTSSSQTNVLCNAGSTGSAQLTVAGGISPYAYAWSPAGGTAATATGLAAGTYTCTITDAASCTTSQSFTITQPSATPGSGTYSLPTSNQTITQTVNSYNYASGSCELITTVTPSGASPVSGTVTNKVWIENTVPVHAGIPYVQRHYEITPTVNASTATGTITLFFTQAEFDAFNAHQGSLLKLPTGPADAAGKSNLRIGKYSGVSGDGTGLPASYSSTAIVIDPADTDIVWNSTSSAWEVSFTVNGFSGFIVQTVSSTLPVSWASFEVAQKETGALLTWSTYTEQNTLRFIVEHSSNAINWKPVGQVNASGNSMDLKQYRFLHTQAVQEVNFYRIQQQDINGAVTYSTTKQLRLSATGKELDIINNPVQNGILKIAVYNRTQTINLVNAAGQTVLQQTLPVGTHLLPVSSFRKGVYLLRTDTNTTRVVIQ